jgi:cholesterol transport system auxiliary component
MRRLLLMLLIVLLAGCFTSGKRGSEKGLAIYDLGLPHASLFAEGRKSPIAVEVRAPLWMDSLGVNYRLVYSDASRLREYSQARWAGPPAQLVQQRLMQLLDLSTTGQAPARCVLRVEISEFSQIFDSPGRSKGVLRGRAFWLNQSRHQLAELKLALEKPADSQDSRGGVNALQATVEQLARDLQKWEKQLATDSKAGVCFS